MFYKVVVVRYKMNILTYRTLLFSFLFIVPKHLTVLTCVDEMHMGMSISKLFVVSSIDYKSS